MNFSLVLPVNAKVSSLCCFCDHFLILFHVSLSIASLYTWFWTWVNSNCPSTLSQSSCQGCNDYSLTFCEAYEGYCNENNYSNNQYCPYTICRAGISHYFQLRIE